MDVAAHAFRYGVRQASRHFGIPPGTVCKWKKKSEVVGYHPIPTKSSRPKSHPKQLKEEIVNRIVEIRLERKRTSEVVYQQLLNEGIITSLNSVRRTIDRHGLMKKRSPWRRWHVAVPRPEVKTLGDLVELDTIHIMTSPKKRIYVFTLIDVYSRWVYARAYERINGATTLKFIAEAEKEAGFKFNMIQSDHGPEFSRWFVSMYKKNHRYTRLGKPNDNAHIERFNRTIQEECLDRSDRNVESLNSAIKKYLPYYNNERLHLGIFCKTPQQLLTKCFQAIG